VTVWLAGLHCNAPLHEHGTEMANARASARTVQRLAGAPRRLAGPRAAGSRAQRRRALVRLAVLGGLAGVAAAWAVASSTVLVHPMATGILRGLVVATTVAVGCYLAHRRSESRFGLLLAANGFLFGLTALSAASDPAVFTLGRIVNVALWFSLAYLFLAFPGDTIASARERAIVYSLIAATTVAWVATLAVSDRLPAGGHFLNCVGACPGNGLQVATVPGGVAAALRLTASASTVLLLVITAVVLVLRMRDGGRLQRRVFAAPLVTMSLVAMAAAAGTVLRESGASADLVYRLSTVGRVSALLLSLSFLAGLVMGRVFVTETTSRLLTDLSTGSHTPGQARDLLARALEQPSLRLAFWLPERSEYVDTDGTALPRSLDFPGSSVTAIERAGRPYAVVVHETALPEARAVIERAGSSSVLALENMRLEAELRASIGDLRASRTRIVAVADSERRRVERDLHDGAQNRLIALRVKLLLLEEADEADAATRARLVHELEADAEAALDDLRSLVRGIYPPLLVDRGLRDALAWAARTAPIETTLDVEGLRRYAPAVEAAVYFCCLEALQNAAKHAGGGARATVRVRELDADLIFDIRDDGSGFRPEDAAQSGGLTNMRDRAGAAGGTLEVTSAPGAGTLVRGVVPTVPSLAAP
jgi:signal transduction histidine kinase